MWSLSSNTTSGSIKAKGIKPNACVSDCSDDEASSYTSREERLECPVCWESFNIVENVPYVLWCGHTLCKNCVLGLQWAVVKFPTLPIQLPLFISCPWCQLLSFRLVWKGNLKFPRKNFFLLWMVESMNGDTMKSLSAVSADETCGWSSSLGQISTNHLAHHFRRIPQTHREQPQQGHDPTRHPPGYLSIDRLQSSIRKSMAFFMHLTAKFPLVLLFLLIVLYVIPASAAILALYFLITVLFALPSCLILYFSYPSLDWLVREIVT